MNTNYECKYEVLLHSLVLHMFRNVYNRKLKRGHCPKPGYLWTIVCLNIDLPLGTPPPHRPQSSFPTSLLPEVTTPIISECSVRNFSLHWLSESLRLDSIPPFWCPNNARKETQRANKQGLGSDLKGQFLVLQSLLPAVGDVCGAEQGGEAASETLP